MTTARFILSIIILLFGACIVVMNWWCVIASTKNKRQGIGRYHSTVPIVSIFLAALSYLIYPPLDKIWIISVPLLDIANWRLLWLPVVFIGESRKKRNTENGNRPEGVGVQAKRGQSAVPPNLRSKN